MYGRGELVGREKEEILDYTKLTVTPVGVRMVGIAVRDPEYILRITVYKIARGEPAALLRELNTLDDARAILQTLRFLAATRLHSLLRALSPALTATTSSEFDSLLEWTVAAIITGLQQLGDSRTTAQEVKGSPATVVTPAVLVPDTI